MTVERYTVNLSDYPDLVVIYLGMRANSLRGIKTLLGFGPQIQRAVAAQPDGLLLHENLIFSLAPPHGGMRQYWRDFDSLEKWARSGTHKHWWQGYLRDTRGTGFWHETYFRGGEVECVYVDMARPVGMGKFAPHEPARASMFSARRRLGRADEAALQSAVAEDELYGT
jgi:Domain of unknown function (DUF4188)